MNLGHETETLEFKKTTGELKEGVVSIAAILNKHQKGELYFGIKPDGTPIGQQISEKTLRDISQEIANHIEPRIYPEIAVVHIDDKDCIHVSFEGHNTPYFAYNVARIRVADEDKVMSQQEFTDYIMERQSSEGVWERKVSGCLTSSVDENSLKEYIHRGHHPIIFMQCGPIRYLVDAKSQADKRTFSHFVIPRFTRVRAPAGSSIQELYAAIVKNENRNASLVEDAVWLVYEGRSPILLTERKEHAAQLAALLQKKIRNVFLLVGSDKPKEKREKLAALQEIPASEEVVVVATGKYIGEGFDAPRLDTLLLAMPISWRGTLAQYAGRLHRNYEGKHEVRIYDYVDVHIPMLERMYHKRLKGYAELGYQVKFGTSDEPVSMIYDGHAAMAAFEQDLSDAAQSIVIVSPYLQKGRVGRLLPILQSAVSRGVKITIHTSEDDARAAEIAAAVDALQSVGAEVILHKGLQQRYAVLDERIVWYGNVDLLAFGRKDTDVLRFENADIAGELLSLTDESECEQLMITD